MRRMMAVMLMLGGPVLSSAQGPVHSSGRSVTTDINGSFWEEERMFAHPELLKMQPENVPPTGAKGGATIPVSELNVPEKALKELQKSNKAMRAGDLRGSSEHLAKALAISPSWSLAHNALGVLYATKGEYDNAVQEFQKAATLNQDLRAAQDNMATVLCWQHRYTEAEPAARHALEIEPRSVGSQYVLGAILVQEGKYSTEAKGLLQKAKEQYPRAWLFLAKASLERGEDAEAAEELRMYLRAPLPSDRKLAEEWLELVKHAH